MGCKKAFVLGMWFLLLMCFLLLVFEKIVLVKEHDDGVIIITTDGHFKIRSAARSSIVVETFAEKIHEVEEDHMISPYAAKVVDINYMSKRRVPNGADPIHNRRAGKYRQPPSKT